MPRPLNDSVWLLFPSGDRKVDGVLVRTDDPERWMDAVVVAMGPGVPASLGVGVGDRVVARVFDGVPVELDGTVYRSVPAGKLLAVLESSGPAPGQLPEKGGRHGQVRQVRAGQARQEGLCQASAH